MRASTLTAALLTPSLAETADLNNPTCLSAVDDSHAGPADRIFNRGGSRGGRKTTTAQAASTQGIFTSASVSVTPTTTTKAHQSTSSAVPYASLAADTFNQIASNKSAPGCDSVQHIRGNASDLIGLISESDKDPDLFVQVGNWMIASADTRDCPDDLNVSGGRRSALSQAATELKSGNETTME